MTRNRKRKRIIWIVAAIIVAAGAIAAFFLFRDGDGDEGTVSTTETTTAFIGDLSANATASGSVVSQRRASLAAESPGRVVRVLVRVGDSVSTGDLLVQLDETTLALNVASAEQNLKLAESQLANLLEEPRPADIAAAEAALESARAQLDDLLTGASAEEIAAREADLMAAEANVDSAQAQLNQTLNAIKSADIAAAEAGLAAAEASLKGVEIQYTRNPDSDDVEANTALAQARERVASAQARLDRLMAGPDPNQANSARATLAAAEAQRDAAQAQLDRLTADPLSSEVAAAEQQIAQAEANLASLQRGPTEEQIVSAGAEIERARINLADAQSMLESASVYAPFDGVVTRVHVTEGELATGPLVDLLDRDRLEIELEVDEIDIGNLSVGQQAEVTLQSWPDQTLEGTLVDIAPDATTSPGSALVVYEAWLALQPTDLPILVGMTADATLTTAEKEDVLLVPNRAITVDRRDGTYSVIRVEGETEEEVSVTIGLRDRQYTEITSGLGAGDVLRIGGDAPRFTFGPPEDRQSGEDE